MVGSKETVRSMSASNEMIDFLKGGRIESEPGEKFSFLEEEESTFLRMEGFKGEAMSHKVCLAKV